MSKLSRYGLAQHAPCGYCDIEPDDAGDFYSAAEVDALLAEWNAKAATWMASPEAAQRLEGYRQLGAKCAELEAQLDRFRRCLTFYADGLHFDNGGGFDTVTGEPVNWLCDEHGSTVEDGSMAAHVLAGGDIDDDEIGAEEENGG